MRLTVQERAEIVHRIFDGHQAVASVAKAMSVSELTVRKWLKRYRGEGSDGLLDRPSAPNTVARRTPDDLVQQIRNLHGQRRSGVEISRATGLSPATVSRYLRRLGLRKAAATGSGKPGSLAGSEANDERYVRILRHATTLFVRRGYERTNIEDVAYASGVGKATIYQYFGDKAGLALTILTNSVEGIAPALQRTLRDDAAIEDVLTRFSVEYIRCMIGKRGGRPFYEFGRLAMEVSYHRPDIARQWIALLENGIANPLRNYIKTQIDEGVLATGDPDILMSFLSESLVYGGTMILAPDSVSTAQLLALAPVKVRLFLDGARARPTN